MYVTFKIFLDEFLFDLKFGAVLFCDGRGVRYAIIARLLEYVDNVRVFEAFTDGPESENKWEPGQESPTLRQVEHLQRFGTEPKERLLPGRFRTLIVFHEFQCPIANEQCRIALGEHLGNIGFRRSEVGMCVVKIAENDPRKND